MKITKTWYVCPPHKVEASGLEWHRQRIRDLESERPTPTTAAVTTATAAVAVVVDASTIFARQKAFRIAELRCPSALLRAQRDADSALEGRGEAGGDVPGAPANAAPNVDHRSRLPVFGSWRTIPESSRG